ncbi:MAG: hypothetical protein FWC56_05500, partial [Phycisphaerae bacterium]|nr:hypothetical protein [Phycisphaerae bacterium]
FDAFHISEAWSDDAGKTGYARDAFDASEANFAFGANNASETGPGGSGIICQAEYACDTGISCSARNEC